MELFLPIIQQVRDFVEAGADLRCLSEERSLVWPDAGGRGIVMKEDLGVELGSPGMESASALLWTENLDLVRDGRITLIGPDVNASVGPALSFGKVILVGVEEFTENNAWDRHREMDDLRFDLDLKGFMIRAVSQYQKEWCRISAEAIRSGFSMAVFASALMGLLRSKSYVKSVEIIVVTSSSEDVTRLRAIVSPALRIIGAMDKMAVELDFDCTTCEYRDVCADAVQLQAIRRSLQERTREEKHA